MRQTQRYLIRLCTESLHQLHATCATDIELLLYLHLNLLPERV